VAVIGVDPGHEGFLVLLGADRALLAAVPMPTAPSGGRGKRVMPGVVALIVCEFSEVAEIRGALLEKQAPRPLDSRGAAYKTGEGYGTLRGVLAALGVPYREETPQKWKRAAGLAKGKTAAACKALSIAAAGERFPGVDLRKSERCRTPHDGKAEALLLAERALVLFCGAVA